MESRMRWQQFWPSKYSLNIIDFLTNQIKTKKIDGTFIEQWNSKNLKGGEGRVTIVLFFFIDQLYKNDSSWKTMELSWSFYNKIHFVFTIKEFPFESGFINPN